jgi:hypothetical protein
VNGKRPARVLPPGQPTIHEGQAVRLLLATEANVALFTFCSGGDLRR